MSSGSVQPLPRELADSIRDARRAVELEQLASSRRSSDSIEVRHGRLVGTIGDADVWTFELLDEAEIRPDSNALLRLPDGGSDTIPVRIVAQDDTTVVLSCTWYLPDDLDRAHLTVDSSFLLDALIRRLDAALTDTTDDRLIEAILLPDIDAVTETALADAESTYDIDADAAEAQERAAQRAIEPGLRFTWGPPGTGKTTVLAAAVDLAVQTDARILVVAHSNVAVDVAIERIAGQVDPALVDRGAVLRVGTPHQLDASVRRRVLADEVAASRRPDVAGRRDDLRAQRRSLAGRLHSSTSDDDRRSLTAELAQLRDDLTELERELRADAARLIDDASIVATTIARLLVDDSLWTWPADIVIVDEASMVSVPHLLAIASRGSSTLSCFGDFRQLPPVAVTDDPAAAAWMARDVFDRAGVIEAHEHGLADDRMTPLRTQFRMGETIAAVVNDLAYAGMLRTGNDARRRGIRLAEFDPGAGSELVVVDTSALGTHCGRPDGGGRSNLLSAAVALAAARHLHADGCSDIGLISPYRAQAVLLGAATAHLDHVTASTIHRFQGSECDAIVVDLVDGHPRPTASPLTGTDTDLSRRLLNVAVSRARGKLVVVADRQFVDERHGSASTTRRLLGILDDYGATQIDALDLITDATETPVEHDPIVRWFTGWSDAAGAADSLEPTALYLPGEPWDGAWLDRLTRAHPDLAIPTDAGTVPLVIGRLGVVIGSTDLGGPAAVLAGVRTSAVVRRILGEPES